MKILVSAGLHTTSDSLLLKIKNVWNWIRPSSGRVFMAREGIQSWSGEKLTIIRQVYGQNSDGLCQVLPLVFLLWSQTVFTKFAQ